MDETDYFQNLDKDNAAMSDQVTRQLDAMTTLRSLIASRGLENAIAGKEKVAKPFNEWKVKIDFEAQTLQGKPYYQIHHNAQIY